MSAMPFSIPPETTDKEPWKDEPRHAMIDLETFGTSPDSVVLSIGVVIYHPMQSEQEAPYYTAHAVLNPTEQILAGRRIDPKTVKWWNDQSDKAKASICDAFDSYRIGQAMDNLREAFKLHRVEHVWGNGADFDNVLTNELCRMVGQEPLIHYRWNRCYRTLRSQFGHLIAYETVVNELTHHNALHDAIYQMDGHKQIHKALAYKGAFA